MNYKLGFIIMILLIALSSTASADIWVSNSSIVSGLVDVGHYSAPTVYDDSGTLKLISGVEGGTFNGYQWSGSTWTSNSNIVTGLGDVGSQSKPTVFNDSGTWKLISGKDAGTFNGFQWNGTGWEGNSSIVSGLGDVDVKSAPTVFNDNGIWKLISGEQDGVFNGYQWSGSTWTSNSSIVTGLGDVGGSSKPVVYYKNGTWKLISGEDDGIFNGFYWNGSTWISDSSIVSGLPDIGYNSAPTVFNDSETWKLISGDTYGDFYGFYLNHSPSIPTSFTNLGNNLIDHTPTITWTEGTDADGDPVSTYVYVGTTSTPTTVEGSTTGETLDLGSTVALNDGTTYYYRLRSYDGSLWSDYTTADEFRMNSLPTVPTISSPLNNSYYTSQPITIQANSTDADGHNLTYYFYGDTVDGSTLLGTSTNGIYVWHQYISEDYILKVRAHDGYEYSEYSNIIYFHSLIPPLLTTDLITNGDFENWSSGPNVAPDSWTLWGINAMVARESTIIKTGNYSAKLTNNVGYACELYQAHSDYEDYKGKTVTFGGWVWCDTANKARLAMYDGISSIGSSYHSGSSSWEWIHVTITMDSSATKLTTATAIPSPASTISAYFYGMILVEGAYPYVTEPLNNSVHTFDFPPLLHDLTFTWQDSDAAGYKYQIATDENFNLISDEGSLSTYTTDISLTANDYFWRLFAYDPITDTYSDSSDVWQFTINETTVSDGTAIDGVVYEITNAGSIAIEGALVNIWNTTWSDSMLVGQNGYYYFDGVHNSTYSLQATKTGYTDSAIELVTATSDATTTRNILLQSTSGAGQQYVDHYVKFIVKSWYGTLYSDVTVNVYLGDAIIPQHTDDTGTDGAVVFELNENQEYRITFIDAAQNIDEKKILYPKESEYSIIVFGANLIPDEPASDDILYTVQGININSTHGFINVSFNDTSSTTTLAELWIKDKNNQSTLYHFDTTDSTKEWSQVVDGGNASYLVVFKIDNAILIDTLTITRTIYFDNDININLGLENNWSYILIAVIIISIPALLATKLNSEIMAVITVLTGWLMVFFGWLTAGMTIEEKITVGLMLLLATLVAFATMVKKGEK